MTLGAVGIAAVCLVLLYATVHAPGGEQGADRSGRTPTSAPPGEGRAEAALTRGAELFARNCAACHGVTGDGAGPFAYLMNPRPRNLRAGNFKLATTENQIPSDDDLRRTITQGMPGSAMPPWGHLPPADIDALVGFVRQLQVSATEETLRQWMADGALQETELAATLSARTQPGSPLAVPREPAFDEVRWFNGRRIYLENCASCHGADGQPVAEAVKFDAEGYPVPPRSFVNGIFKGGSEGQQLYARIWKGMKGTPMPASEGVYSADEMWDLIHYVQTLARTGAQERAMLRRSTIPARSAEGPLPKGPRDAAWGQAEAVYVSLTPLWWTEERIEGLVVQALHDESALALRLAWLDPTADDRAVRQEEFRDAVAVQFSLRPDPPFFMGDLTEQGGVSIWMWKADRQKNIAAGYQDVDAAFPDRVADVYPEQGFKFTDMSVVERPREELTKHDPTFLSAWGAGNLVANPTLKTPVESLSAQGPGTLGARPLAVQSVQGQAEYERGVWYVQLQRPLKTPEGETAGPVGDPAFRPGESIPVSFAVWNGAAGDRAGKKNISVWQVLQFE